MTETDENIDFHILQLASSIEQAKGQSWIIEIARAIASTGGRSLIPGKISRSEPSLRRAGALVIDEPLDEDRRSGAQKRLAATVIEHEIKAYFVHDLEVMDLALSLHKLHPAPIFLISHQSIEPQGYFATRKLQKQISNIDYFVATSQNFSQKLVNGYQIDPSKISLIYEGLDLQETNSEQISQERTMSLAHSWGAVEDAAELVLIPSSYNDPYWCDRLMHFARAVREFGSDNLRYVVIGDDNGTGAMARLQNQLYKQSLNQIQLAGYCADVEAAIKLTSTVLYLYSEQECQFSIALYAQALGRFVFVPERSECAPEFIEIERSGHLIGDDPGQIVERIHDFINNQHDLRQGNFLASRSFIMQHFSKETMQANLRALIENTLF